jgi:F-type H+-transporting ATP synthase subunit e
LSYGQVLRYSALFAGVFYGLWHQSSLNSRSRSAELDREYKHKESLIEQAKAEWKKKNTPQQSKTASGGRTSPLSTIPMLGGNKLMERTVITDPEDSRFDLEAFLQAKAAESMK